MAVDSVGGDATATLVQMLSDRGVLVTYSAASGQPLAVYELLLIGKNLTVKGFFLGHFDHMSKILPAQIEAAPLVASGALRVPVAAVYPMSKIKEAVAHLLKGGKILIDVASTTVRAATAARLLRPPDNATGGRLIQSDQETDMTKTTPEQNKALVLEAFETLFNKRDYAGAERFWSDPYIQHSAHIASGRAGLFDLVRSLPQTLRYENQLILAEGDYVIAPAALSNIGRPAAWIAADIAHVEDGKLTEHWDVLQDEATRAESASGLPMFGERFPS